MSNKVDHQAWLEAWCIEKTIALGSVANVQCCIEGDQVELIIKARWLDEGEWCQRLEQDFLSAFGVASVRTRVERSLVSHAIKSPLRPLGGIKNVIAVGSGKGGVGKSTVAAALALSLSKLGAKVGLLDADIYGPNGPALLGSERAPLVVESGRMQPVMAQGIATMSMHYLLNEREDPVVWRGPMASKGLMQMATQTRWGALDYLIVDLPPGTGDVQLTLVQKLPVVGVVMVTTPQTLSCLDTAKGIAMFQSLDVPVLGVVENMAKMVCSSCGHVEHVWGSDGGVAIAEHHNVPFLGSLLFSSKMVAACDENQLHHWLEDKGNGACYSAIARLVGLHCAALPKYIASGMPPVVVETTRR